MKQINLRTNCAVALGLGMMLAMAPRGFAQAAPPPDPGAPAGAPAGGTQAPADLGSIDTSKQSTVTTTTTTQPADDANQVIGGDDNTKPLPNTGGEPLVFVLAGGMLIAGGWALRRKWTFANEQ